jgi:hypothetical protein
MVYRIRQIEKSNTATTNNLMIQNRTLDSMDKLFLITSCKLTRYHVKRQVTIYIADLPFCYAL